MSTVQTGPDRPPGSRPAPKWTKLVDSWLDDLAERYGLGGGSRNLLCRLVRCLADAGWEYEPRTIPARSRRQLWERYLGYDGHRYLDGLIAAGLVAEHPGLGIEVLRWGELVADTDKEKADRRKRAVADLRGGSRRKADYIRAIYAASPLHDLPGADIDRTNADIDRTNADIDRTNADIDRTRPAKTAPISLDHLDPLDPAPPSDGADPVRFDTAGGEGNQKPGTDRRHRIEALAEASQPATLEARRFHAQVLDLLADLKVEEKARVDKFIPNQPIRFRDSIRAEVKADPNLGDADNVARYRNDHPDADTSTLADLIWSDRPGASPPIRPSPPSPEVVAARRAANGVAQAEAVDFQKAYK